MTNDEREIKRKLQVLERAEAIGNDVGIISLTKISKSISVCFTFFCIRKRLVQISMASTGFLDMTAKGRTAPLVYEALRADLNI